MAEPREPTLPPLFTLQIAKPPRVPSVGRQPDRSRRGCVSEGVVSHIDDEEDISLSAYCRVDTVVCTA